MGWFALGFAAQLLFSARFVVQWVASERRRRSYFPMAFWYLSLSGSALLLAYSIWRQDPVFILGQSFNSIIYVRNLMLIFRHRGEQAGRPPAPAGTGQ
ncbi:MAG: lipid-A-disaccharide synthase N-terminal domain-containing protein [Candidatus Brocadiia bacterium]